MIEVCTKCLPEDKERAFGSNCRCTESFLRTQFLYSEDEDDWPRNEEQEGFIDSFIDRFYRSRGLERGSIHLNQKIKFKVESD